MSWEGILKVDYKDSSGSYSRSDDFLDILEKLERTLDNTFMKIAQKEKHGNSLSPNAKEKVNSLLMIAGQQLDKLKQLDELDGSEVQFKETMDKLSAYL
jgi:ClpP class serine protease